MDEVFGSGNLYRPQIVFRKTTGKGSQLLDNTYDTILWYAEDRDKSSTAPSLKQEVL